MAGSVRRRLQPNPLTDELPRSSGGTRINFVRPTSFSTCFVTLTGTSYGF